MSRRTKGSEVSERKGTKKKEVRTDPVREGIVFLARERDESILSRKVVLD